MNRNGSQGLKVSQEELVTATGLLIAGAGSLLAAYAPQAISAITKKLAATATTKTIEKAKEAAIGSVKGDLVRFTQSARVEPIMLLDKRSLNTPFIQDVVHSMYNMFTGYWLLAISLDSKINGVSVGRRLDKFATDRDLADATMTMLTSSNESYKASLESFGLPFIEEIIAEEDAAASMESVDDKSMANASSTAADLDNEKEDKTTGGVAISNAAKYVEKVNNLAVGNVIDVTISEDGKSVVVPVTIRLRVAGMPSDVMVQTLAVGGKDVTFGSRWRAWRAGEIGFWSDFVLQMDRVDAHRAAMMKDETGYYKAVYGRARNNAMAEVLTQGPSLGTASALLVMDVKTAEELERRINGRLQDFKTRQAIFGHTYSMLMAVVDPDWESVTIYTRGIEMASKFQARDIKSAGKSDSKELMDILKSYQLGRAPGRI